MIVSAENVVKAEFEEHCEHENLLRRDTGEALEFENGYRRVYPEQVTLLAL